MLRRKGFTLVELLVVIGIIAVLIGILLPALNGARQRSYVIKCAANMRTIGQSMINYCAENNDYLPLWSGFGVNGPKGGYKSRSSTGFPAVGTTLFQNAGYSSVANDLGGNLGVLIRCGFLGNLQWSTLGNQNTAQNDNTWAPVRFCPGDYANMGASALKFESSYVFNPHWTYTAQPYAAGFGVTTEFLKLNSYPATLCLLTENIIDQATTAHHQLKNGIYVFNLLYRDGHVDSVNDAYIFSQLTATGGGTSALNDEQKFEGYLDVLECEVEGKDYNTVQADAMFGPVPLTAGKPTTPYYSNREWKAAPALAPRVNWD